MNKLNIINLTPHELNLQNNKGEMVSISPEKTPARLSTTQVVDQVVGGLNVYITEFGAVENLPEPQEDTIFVVSRLVLDRVKDSRPDVFSTGNAIRDENGRIIGAEGLSR